jgi:hypothetical protein
VPRLKLLKKLGRGGHTHHVPNGIIFAQLNSHWLARHKGKSRQRVETNKITIKDGCCNTNTSVIE